MKKAFFTLSFMLAAYILNAQVLYGTTLSGGKNFGGTICKLVTATNTLTASFSLDAADVSGAAYSKLLQVSYGRLDGITNRKGTIFPYDPAASKYVKQESPDTNYTGTYIAGALIKDQANKLYGMTALGGSYGAGTIFSYDANTSVFTKLKDFDYINGANALGSLVQAADGKMYGMTPYGGANNDGVIFSFDPSALMYTKLKDFDGTDGAGPLGNLIQASDGKLYGMTSKGGSKDSGVIFSYEPVTGTYTKLKDFDFEEGASPAGSLIQASDGKLYGTTSQGGSNDVGVIFSFDPVSATYTKLVDFDGINGALPYCNLIQASDGKLYGMTSGGGGVEFGVIFSFDPAASTYTRLTYFNVTNGAFPYGSLMQASDGKLYGMTSNGGSNYLGVAFSYDPATSTYTKLSDFNVGNGSYPILTSFTEIPGEVQISILDKSVIEGNQDTKYIAVPVMLNEQSEKTIRVHYATRDGTAAEGSDYVTQFGTLIFPPGIKRIVLPLRIKGDQLPEADETFRIKLSDPVNAVIADSTSTITILDDDASTLNAVGEVVKNTRAISLSPNPSKDKLNITLTGYNGRVVVQLSSMNGRMLQQQKLQIHSAKSELQQINVASYANGTYLVTAIDEKGNRQTKKLIIDR